MGYKNPTIPTIIRLRNADPKAYAELCERAGFYDAAFDYYSNSDNSKDLLHAAELAGKIGKRKGDVRRLCDLAKMAVDSELESAEREAKGPLSGMGSAIVYSSVQDHKKEIYKRVEDLCS